MRRSKKGALVLLAGGETNDLERLGRILEEEGYRVQLATDARSTVEKLRALEEPCVLVLDGALPADDGSEVLGAIGHDRSLPEVNVIVMTTEVALIGSAGELPLIRKPVDISRLLSLVERYAFPPRAS